MAKPKCKRNKPYREKPIRLNTMQCAIKHKAALSPHEVADIISKSRASLEALRSGSAVSQDWFNLSECAGIALDLSRIGICSDDNSIQIFLSMYQACGAIGTRHNQIGRLVAKGPELSALADGLDHHELQLGFCSADELMRACNARKAQVLNAKTSKVELITLRVPADQEEGEVVA